MLDVNLLVELQKYVEHHRPREVDVNGHLEYCDSIKKETRYRLSMEDCDSVHYKELEGYIEQAREPNFRDVLFHLIEEKGISDTEIYKDAGMDRRHFSKIRTNRNYQPGKTTVIALILALKLNEEEAWKLLHSAGYSLSKSSIFDLIVCFCLEKEIYDLDAVNYALDYFGIKTLLGVIE